MNLLVRINLALGVTLGVATFAVGAACWSMLQANAQREVLQEAGLMMDSALAIRSYTSGEILPLLGEQMRTEFLPQSVPSYAATQNFLKLRQQHPQYIYKEATLNPTNPRDRATDWESDLIQQFRNNAQMHELIGERDTPMGRALYLARPIHAGAECQICHSQPAVAPKTLLARYGSDHGFGWQVNEIVGAHVVSVPLEAANATALRVFRSMAGWTIAILLTAVLIVNLVVDYIVIRPIRRIASLADEMSTGNVSAGDFPTKGSSEVMMLVHAFSRMRTSLDKAMKLLER